jgi:DNA-binding transcriptional ArsR family regulator
MPSPIPLELAELIAERFCVIGDPTRIRILDQLRASELSVNEITAQLDTSQQNVSKHLGVLYGAGIVSRRKEGTSSIYSISDETIFGICEQVCGGLQERLAELTETVGGAS